MQSIRVLLLKRTSLPLKSIFRQQHDVLTFERRATLKHISMPVVKGDFYGVLPLTHKNKTSSTDVPHISSLSTSPLLSKNLLCIPTFSPIRHNFILPTYHQTFNAPNLTTIVDPKGLRETPFDLPTVLRKILEKVTPPSNGSPARIVEDPLSPQSSPISVTPHMVTIRHKKMKKHKLRKLRKVQYFVRYRRVMLRKKQKEKRLQEEEQKYRKVGEDFDAEKFVDEQIALAKKGGWGVDIFKTRAMGRGREGGGESGMTKGESGAR